jgi:hypothetical protein
MNKLAILPLLAMVFTIGLAPAYAHTPFGEQHDITTDENISENPAIAERYVLLPNSYGYDVTRDGTGNKEIVCGDHLCADGEQPPVLSKFRFYGLMGN